MSVLAELIPKAKSLSRADKLRLIQLLAEELAEDESSNIAANQTYAVWSPDHAFNAADVMLRALADETRERAGQHSQPNAEYKCPAKPKFSL